MRHIYIREQDEITGFALEAAEHFAIELGHTSYTSGEIEEGSLFALRWGTESDGVLVFRIGGEPLHFREIIGNVT